MVTLIVGIMKGELNHYVLVMRDGGLGLVELAVQNKLLSYFHDMDL